MLGREFELLRSGRGDGTIRPQRHSGLASIRRGVHIAREDWKTSEPWVRHRLRIEAFRLVNPTAILSHQSAALAHGLPTFGDPGAVHVFHDGVSNCYAADVTFHRSRDLRRVVQTSLGPATALVETMIDVGRTNDRAAALAMWDAGLAQGVDLDEIVATVHHQRNTRHIRTLQWLTREATAVSESPGESVSRALIQWLGFGEPELQIWVNAEDEEWRPDFAWRDQRILAEFDGLKKYGETEAARIENFLKEKRREDALRRAGYDIVRWEYRDLIDPRRLERILLQHGVRRVNKQEPASIAAWTNARRRSTPPR